MRSFTRNREQGGATGKFLVVFFLLGLIVIALLARGCYSLVKSSFQPKPSASKPAAVDPKRFAFPEEKCPDFAPEKVAEQRAAQAAARVPVIPGLIMDVVTVIQDKDLEALHQVVSEDDHAVTLGYSGPGYHMVNGHVVIDSSLHSVPVSACRKDLLDAPVFVGRLYEKHPTVVPGSTQEFLSRAVFEQLKNDRLVRLPFRTQPYMQNNKMVWQTQDVITFRRTDNGSATVRVIVNGTPTDLPVITADGASANGPAHLRFAVLDEPASPLGLAWEWVGQPNSTKTVKITYPVQQKVEKELQEQGRAEIYGIYFDFDSADIRAESEPVLAEIAGVLKKNPAWKLSIEGHTDNIGGDKHNMELSQKRSASVKQALVGRYQIVPDQLTAAGFGASKPKAANDTVEGRALNRRVELVRQ